MKGRTGYVARARVFASGQGKKVGLIEKQVLQDKTKSIRNDRSFRNNSHTTFTKQVKRVLEIPKPGIAKEVLQNQSKPTLKINGKKIASRGT